MAAHLGRFADTFQQPHQNGIPTALMGQRLPYIVHLGIQKVVKKVINVLIMIIKRVSGQSAILYNIPNRDLIQRFYQQESPERGMNRLFCSRSYPDRPLS